MSNASGWVIAGQPTGALPVIGGVYDVRHSRKGSFTMRVTDISGEWLSGVIVKGTAKAIMSYNTREAGESITVRDTHSYLIPRMAPVLVTP